MTIWPVFETYENVLMSVHSTEQAAEEAAAYYGTAFADCQSGEEQMLLEETGQEAYYVGEPQVLDVVQLGPDDIEEGD